MMPPSSDITSEVVVLDSDDLFNGKVSLSDLAILCGFAATHTTAKSLVREGGIRINSVTVTDPHESITVQEGDIVQCGRRFVTLHLKD